MPRCRQQSKGQWARLSPSPIGAGPLWAIAAFVTFLVPVPAAGAEGVRAAEVEYAKPITNRLNPTGRAITMLVPLKDGEVLLGDILVRINPDDTVLINKTDLKERLKGSIADAAVAGLDKLGEPGGFVALPALESANLKLRFDPGLQELQLILAIEQRPTNDISLRNRPAQPNGATLASPAKASGYLNVTAGLDHAWNGQGTAAGANTSGRLELDSALRLHGSVFENKALYEGEVDANVCPTGARCVYQHASGFKRQSSRLVYDKSESHMRFSLGDTDALAGSLQRSFEMLGFSVEKSAAKLTKLRLSRARCFGMKRWKFLPSWFAVRRSRLGGSLARPRWVFRGSSFWRTVDDAMRFSDFCRKRQVSRHAVR